MDGLRDMTSTTWSQKRSNRPGVTVREPKSKHSLEETRLDHKVHALVHEVFI